MRTSIYRTREGRDAIAAWCRDQLDGWSTPHTTSVIPTPLGDTFTVTAGTGSHVLLLPGTNFPTSSWLPVVGVLASGYTVVAVDVPGQPGLSAGDRPQDFVAAYGDWLRALIEALNIEPVVVAHSMGAVIALAGAGRGAPVTSLGAVQPGRVGPP